MGEYPVFYWNIRSLLGRFLYSCLRIMRDKKLIETLIEKHGTLN